MKKIIPNLLFSLTLSLLCSIPALSQTDTSYKDHYEGLSLQDLLDQKIISVSKKSELLFDAALSASVLTKEDIQRAGASSIMEALRLVPGVIVREQSNGNYDIHLRGMDNVPPNASFDMASTTTLVMINNRPVYSYLRGGTFWETIPVDINDVEKIEVVRGPAGALYGPNAVNGVINIITRKTGVDGLYLVANSRQGSNRTFINNASVGYQSGKWSAVVSGNYQARRRTQTSYFEFYRNQWFDNPSYMLKFQGDTARNISERFPLPILGLEKYAGNIFLNYDASQKTKLSLTAGTQHSVAQKISAENEITPLSTSSSDTRYIDLRAEVAGFTGQFSYNTGQQNVDFDAGNKFDFHTLDANIEYNYNHKNFSLKPGISYRNSLYDDTKYSDIVRKNGVFNAHGEITTLSGSLRSEYSLFDEKIKLIGGLALNKFNYPDTTYISSQLAMTYKPNKNHLFRLVYSQSPRSSNIFDTFVDQTIAYFPSGFRQFTRMGLWGDKNLRLFTAKMFEAGYRGHISSTLTTDIEIFDIKGENTNVMVTSRPFTRTEGVNTIVEIPIISSNLPLTVRQQGITASLTYTTQKLQIKPFLTLQRTRIKNYAPYHNTPDAGTSSNHIYSGMGTEITHKGTPALFGGASINWVPNSKLNININSYYYTSQRYHHLSNVLFNDGIRGIDNINGKIIINAAVSYEAIHGLHFFLGAKNLLGDKSREFFHADEVPFHIQGGITCEF
jgi:iron complex outermembrane recepter protein